MSIECFKNATGEQPYVGIVCHNSIHYLKVNFLLLPSSVTPAPPSSLRYTKVRRDSVTLEWEPPEHDGGSELTGYLIEKRDIRKDRWSFVHKVPHTQRQFEVGGLLTGQEYMFRVRPVNRMGLGEAIQPEEPVKVATPYSKHSNSGNGRLVNFVVPSRSLAAAPLTQSSIIESSIVHVNYHPLPPLTILRGWPSGLHRWCCHATSKQETRVMSCLLYELVTSI